MLFIFVLRIILFYVLCSYYSRGSSVVVVRALKTLLFARSSVFFAMFCGEMADQREVIEITDVDPNAFKELIRYMFCFKCILVIEQRDWAGQ